MSGRLQNQLVTIGQMSELVAIAQKVEALDDFGAVINAVDEPLTFIRAKVSYDSTDEAEQNAQLKFTTKIKVWTRYNTNWTIEKLVFWDEKYYEIYAVEKIIGNRFHVIKARLIET